MGRSMPGQLVFLRRPSALAFMARAILTPRRPGLQAEPPALAAAWRGHRVGGATLDDFLSLTGLVGHAAWPLLYPQVFAFRLQMVVLTDRGFPLPIWNSLQIRNQLLLHETFDRDATLDFETRVAAQRVVDRGVEIDLVSTACAGDTLHWESTNTFYYRGRFGVSGEDSPLAVAPRVEGAQAASWKAPAHGRLRFGRLTGDYNGIHLSDRYARRFGFRGAFLHPQRVLGECLARLPHREHSTPLRLDTWLKGPVYYSAEVALRVDEASDAVTFALHANGDERPAVVGRLYG
jgi:hypothetical protein